ncbi:MAG: helix-turn-helix domain-containing protein [Candidatus Dormibacteraceae bacterium]
MKREEVVPGNVVEFRNRDEDLLKVEDVRRILKVGRSTVYELIARQELTAVHIGRLVRVPRTALKFWIEVNTVDAQQEERAA